MANKKAVRSRMGLRTAWVMRSHDIDGSCVEVLLVENLLHQVGGGLGECELAEARIDGSEVGVDDLVEGVVVLHGVSFRTTAWFLASFFFSTSCGASLLCCFSCSSFFCCFSVVPLLYARRYASGMPQSSFLL